MATSNLLSYAIIGTGAIGGYYGSRLQQAGCDVHFLLRSDYEHVKKHGLVIESVDGDVALKKVNAYNTPDAMPAVDVVIVALKTTQNQLLHHLLPPIKPGGAILSLQNGLGIEGAIAKRLSDNGITVPTILGGLCFICSNKISSGHIRHTDYGKVLLGTHDENSQLRDKAPLLETIEADLKRAKIPIETTLDLPMARWRKLVWNVPYNGLSVVLDATTEAMMADSGIRALITTLMEEVVSVANAWGEDISPGSQRGVSADVITQMISHTETMPPYRTSMKIDYDEGRPLEIEAIVGNPIRIAKAVNVAVPAMTMLYQQLSFLNERNRAQ